jgi:hypothetical protein
MYLGKDLLFLDHIFVRSLVQYTPLKKNCPFDFYSHLKFPTLYQSIYTFSFIQILHKKKL